MSKELITVEISEEIIVEVQPHEEHEWLLSSKDVAEGYGLSASGLRSVKERYFDELDEGNHYIMKPSQKGTPSTYWTKEGVVMLGFFIKTPTAKEFRRWASNYIVSKQAEVQAPKLPTTYLEALEELVAKEKLVLEMKPKVELYDTLTHQDEDTINDMTLSEVAKALGYKPKAEFFPMLRKAGIVFQASTEPTAVYVDKGWFRGTPIKKGGYTGMSWKVTPKGMAGMLKKFGKGK